MTGFLKKIAVGAAAFALVFSSIYIFGGQAAVAEDSDFRIDFELKTMNTNSEFIDRSDFYTEEPFQFAPDVQTSGNGVNLVDAVLELKVPKSPQGYWGKPAFIDSSQGGVSTEISETASDYIVKYKYTSLRGGVIGTYPTAFKFDRKAPNGTTITPTWILYQNDGSVLRQSTKTYTAVAKNEYTVNLTNYSSGTNSWDQGEVDKQGNKYKRYGCRVLNPSEKDTTVVPASGCHVQYQMGNKFIPFPGVNSSYGRYEPKTNRLTVTAPKGVKLAGSYTPGAGSSFKDNGDGTFTATNVWADWEYNRITLNYVGMPFDTKFDLKVTFETDYDNPDLHKTYTSTASTILSKKLVDYTQTGTLGLDRRYYSNDSAYQSYSYGKSQIFRTQSNELVYEQAAKEKERPGMRWETSIWNNNNGSDIDARPYRNGKAYLVKKLTDYGMDSRLAYRSFQLTYVNALRDSSYENTTKFKEYFASIGNALYGVKADGSREKIAENLGIDQEVFISKTGERLYESLELEFAEPLVLDNSEFKYVLSVVPTDEEMGKWERDEYSSEQKYRGEVKVEGELALPDGNGKYLLKNTTVNEETGKGYNDTLTLWKLNPQIYNRFTGGKNVTYVNCETRKIDLASGKCDRVVVADTWFYLDNSWGIDVYKAKNLKQVILLPPGIEYVPNHPNSRFAGIHRPNNNTAKVIPNYRGTGMTALVWEYGSIGPSSLAGTNTGYSEIYFALDVSLYANQGNNTVRSYVLWDNGDEVKARGKLPADDPLGKTLNNNEAAVVSTIDYFFTPPLEIITKKYASADGQAWAYNSAPSDIGGDVFYKVTVTNNSAYPRGDISVIDVLPHQADHAVAPNEHDQYPDRTWLYSDENENVTEMRHSAFTTPLTQSLESLDQNAGVLEDWEFFYSLTEQGADLASVRDSQWLRADEIKDWSAVKSVKIQLKSGKKLDKNTTKEFVMRSQVPYTKETIALPDGYKAVNSVAQSVNGSDYLEANKTTSEFMRYKIKGFVFKDFNGDGKRSADEDKVGNVKVELLHAADNTPVTDIEGNPLTGFTNDKGEYEFTAFKRGDYKVRFTTSEFSEFTTVPSSGFDEENDNSTTPVTSPGTAAGAAVTGTLAANPATAALTRVLGAMLDRLPAAPDTTLTPIVGISGATHVDPTKPFGYANASVGASTRDLVVFKHDQDGQPIAGVKFDLKWKEATPGNLEPNPIPSFTTGTTGKDGILVYKNLPYGKYTLTEVSVPAGVTKLSAPVDIEVSSAPFARDEKGVALGYAPILNQVVKGTVKVVKADADNPDTKLAGAVFVLKDQDGQVVYTSSPSGRDGVATFEKVAFGSYTLAEQTAPDLYTLSKETRSVVINQVDQVVTFEAPFTNEIFKGGVKVKKLDRDTRAPLAGAVFGVFKDGKEIARATSGKDGIATVTGVPYGRGYQVKEVEAPTGYLISESWKSYNFDVLTEGAISDYSSDSQAFLDQEIKGTIIFRKVDDSGNGLDDVEFELQKRSDSSVVAIKGTNLTGYVYFEDIPYGDYKIVEKSAPAKYIMSTTPVNVEIRNQRETVRLNDIVNPVKKANITFKTVDKDTKEPVAGIRYRLCEDRGWSCEYATSDKDGKVVFENASYGGHTLREESTLDMYVPNPNTYNPEIVENGKHVDLGTIEIVKKTGTVRLYKIDSLTQQVLPGAVFELKNKDGKVLDTQTSDTNGEIVFRSVPYGRYTVAEKTAPTGYNVNEWTWDGEIEYDGQEDNLGSIKNVPINGDIVFKVVDKETGELVDNVEYQLCATTDQTGANCLRRESSYGQVSFRGVTYGDYYITQVSSPDQYVPDTLRTTVSLRKQGETIETDKRELVKKKGTITFTKVDSENGSPLQGAEFELKDGNLQLIATQTSDKNGKVTFADVPVDYYVVTEKTAPAGYELDNQLHLAELTEHKQVLDLGKIGNQPLVTSVSFLVIDKETKEKLDGVEYQLCAKSDKTGKSCVKASSANGGQVQFDNVRFGDYQVREVKTLAPYVPDTAVAEFSIKDRTASITLDKRELVKKKGTVELSKVAAKSKQALVGVSFELQDLSGQVLATETTNDEGKLVFSDVVYGEYQVVEKATLTGYQLDTTPRKVAITEDKQVIDLGEIPNELVKSDISFTVVDKETGEVLDGVEYQLCPLNNQDSQECIQATSANGGEVLFPQVDYGKYQVSETKTLAPYVPDTDKVKVNVEKGGEKLTLDKRELVKLRGSISFIKVDGEDQNKVLPGVTFELRDGQGAVLDTQTSDKDGKVSFSNLLYGDYTLVEVSTQEGYVLSEKATNIAIRENGVNIDLGKIANEPVRGNIKVIVRDKTTKAVIPGAEYVLKDEKDQVVAIAISDANGVLAYAGIRYGHYTLALSKAPLGYRPSEETQEIKVETNNLTVEAEDMYLAPLVKAPAPPQKAENPQKTKQLVEKVLANTGASGLDLAVGLMLLGACGLGLRRRQTRSEN